MTNKVKVGIIGVTGYTGGELLRLLLAHPFAQVAFLGTSSKPGPLGDIYPRYAKTRLVLETIDPETIAKRCDVVFIAAHNGIAMELAPKLLAAGPHLKIIDLSADYRIKDTDRYHKYYKIEHLDTANLKKAAYGLPELNRAVIKTASVIANPGCYPTAAALGLAPVLGYIDITDIIIDAKSGVSGAGKKSETEYSFCELDENLKPYGIVNHRHIPEIEQTLSDEAGSPVSITFTPHLIPMIRGMLTTSYTKLIKPLTQGELDKLYADYYADEPNVIYTPNISTSAVMGTNLALVYAVVEGDKIKVFSAIDNLVKGAAGQAVQNLNVIMDYDEGTGL